MKLKKAKDGGCGTAATFVILCLLCCPALARKPTSTGASSAAVLLSSDSRDTERTVDESISNDTSSEPARPDYNSETPVVWLKESGIPITVECLIAFCWIGMVASMPLIVLVLEGGSVTRTQIVTFTVMWLVLAGGVVLFHKVLLFQSSHFLHQRSLTLVECVYLMSQILTTVGYGDITPSTQRSQAVVAVYVIFSLVIIANVASEAANAIERRTANLAEELRKQIQTNIIERLSQTMTSNETSEETAATNENKGELRSTHTLHRRHTVRWASRIDLPPLPWTRLLRSFLVYLLFCVMGCVFYVNYPGENKTLLDGVYMSVITLSTVGFGAVTPATEGGKVFGCFWMFFGSAALFKLVGDFMALVVMMKQREMWNAEEEMKKGIERIEQLPSTLSAHEFMKFSLVQRGIMKEKDVNMLDRAFLNLNPAADGTISKEDARKFLDL